MRSALRAALLPAILALSGCQTLPDDAPRASAVLMPTKGSNVYGTVKFVQVGNHVRVSGYVHWLPPNREFGFHVHEAGDCGSGDGMSAKGHFNPLGKPHGHPAHAERHAGDLPNLRSDAGGNAVIEAELDTITVSPGISSIVGRGLIVHALPDDYRSQPTGNAGARSACAVIKRS